MKPKAARIYEV